jgi:hypothetical protein
MMSTWRAAYERRPAIPAEQAFAALTSDDREPIPDHPCGWCQKEIPPERLRLHARYCSDSCKAASNGAIELEKRTAKREAVSV